MHLSVPFKVLFMFLYVGSYLLVHEFESWITGVCSPYVVLCVILHTMWTGKRLKLLCILPFNMLCLSAISMMCVNIMLAVCMLVGMLV